MAALVLGSLDRRSVALYDRGDAGAVAGMSDHQPARQVIAELAYNRFTPQAVKSVPLEALGLKFRAFIAGITAVSKR
jgi:hypothetical protein